MLQGAYDKVAKDLVKPLVDSVKGLSKIFDDSSKLTGGGIFKQLTDSIKPIPDVAEHLAHASEQLQNLQEQVHGLPWIYKLQQVTTKMQGFTEDIKEDAMNFYEVKSYIDQRQRKTP